MENEKEKETGEKKEAGKEKEIQLYVPDKAYLICTQGMHKQQIKVSSQSSIFIAGGRLGATIKDRTGGNFICARMIVAGAIIVAAAVAFVAIAAPAAITIGVGAALAAGATGGALAGGLLAMMPCTCALLTMSHDWAPVHPRVTFEKKQALIEKSVVQCLLGGNVLIQYSEEAAQAAMNMKRKETAFQVVFIIGAAYLAGPAVEGLGETGTMARGILKNFGRKALASYLGSVGLGFATNFAIDYEKDQGKTWVYKQIGVNEYVEGSSTDIQEIQEKQADSSAEPSEAYDNAKRTGESTASGKKVVGNRTGDFETTSYESSTVLNSQDGTIEEANSDRVSTATPGAIPAKNTTVTTASGNDFYSDQSGSYMHTETYTQETGQEFRPMNLSENGNVIKEAASGWKESYLSKPEIKEGGNLEGGGLIMDVVVDAYKGVTHWMVKGDIEKYIEALKTAEKEAKASVTVVESEV